MEVLLDASYTLFLQAEMVAFTAYLWSMKTHLFLLLPVLQSINTDVMQQDLDVTRVVEPVGQEWALIVFLLLFGGLAWVRVVDTRRFGALLRMFVYQRFLRQAVREEELLGSGISMVFTTVFVSSGAFLLYHLMGGNSKNWFSFELTGVLLFLLLVAAVFLTYLVKYSVVKLIQFVFDVDRGLNEHLYNTWLLNVVLGIVLLPIVLVINFSSWQGASYLMWGALGLVGVFFLYRLIRGIRTGIGQKVSIFYLFIYLCSLEILPLVVLAVVFTDDMNEIG